MIERQQPGEQFFVAQVGRPAVSNSDGFVQGAMKGVQPSAFRPAALVV